MADLVVRRGMSVPAVMLLECWRPFGFLGSQVLHFLKPFATLVLNPTEYERFARLLERREAVNLLLDAIEANGEKKHG